MSNHWIINGYKNQISYYRSKLYEQENVKDLEINKLKNEIKILSNNIEIVAGYAIKLEEIIENINSEKSDMK